MRYLLCGVALVGLAACEASLPDSGVGFGNYTDYRKTQDQQAADQAGNPLPSPMAVSEETLEPSRTGVSGTVPAAAPIAGQPQDEAARLAADTAAVLSGGAATQPAAQPETAPAKKPELNNPGISSENDFKSVSAERTIQSDAERLAQNKAQYQVVQPTSVPMRSGGTGPNIVEYALKTSNPIGTPMYARGPFSTEGRAERNCAKYASADQAQLAFLERGGPERDGHGLDPDGDGYACDWDPRPFRKASGG